MKDPRQRIGPFPACCQPRLKHKMRVLLHQRVVDEATYPFRLRIGSLPQIEVVRRALNEKPQRVRILLPSVARCQRQQQRSQRCDAQCTNSHASVTLPSTTGRAAPVALGRLPGSPCHVSHPSNANAAASFAPVFSPVSSTDRTRTCSASSNSLSVRISVAFRTPPPAAINSTFAFGASFSNCGLQKRTYASAIVLAVNAVAAAITSSLRSLLDSHAAMNSVTKASPYSSRPQDFGGGAEKYGIRSSFARPLSITRPRAAVAPLRSKPRPNSRSMHASITMLAGPVSKASTSSARHAAGSSVRFAIPPRFSSTRLRFESRNTQKSNIGTSGAACPPAAISAARKSLTTGTRKRSAITAASPVCHVHRTGAPRYLVAAP